MGKKMWCECEGGRGECVLYVLNVLCHVFVLYECHHVSVREGISAAL